jgi:HPt (histidine-containing phosphotransfer) domain-containing protein
VDVEPTMSEILDPDALAGLLAATGHDPDRVGELVDRFLSDGSVQLEWMRRAIDADSPEDLVRYAQILGSTAESLGAMALADRCRAIEERANTGAIGDAGSWVTDAEIAFADVSDALEEAGLDDWEVT